jgi:SAM-dependent methyltransferase
MKEYVYNKDYLRIRSNMKVLEVGPGNNPSRRANVLVEKFVQDNTHRRGDLKIYKHQKLIEADGEKMPFKNHEFDFIICSHVIEHTDNPLQFMEEQFRVASGGYLSAPSLFGEFLAPKESHKWVSLVIDGKLVMFEKSKLPYDFSPDFGDVYLNHMPYKSLLFRLTELSTQNFMSVKIKWKGRFDVIVNPEDDYLKSFFSNKIDQRQAEILFPKNWILLEIGRITKVAIKFFLKMIKDRFFIFSKPIPYEDYIKKHGESS